MCSLHYLAVLSIEKYLNNRSSAVVLLLHSPFSNVLRLISQHVHTSRQKPHSPSIQPTNHTPPLSSRFTMIRITSLRRPKNRLPPLKKGASSRVLPKIPSPLKKKKKNVVEPCSVTSRSQTLDTFSPTDYLRNNGFAEYQRNQPTQDSDFSDSDSEFHGNLGNHGNATNHFLKGNVNFTVLGEEYLPGFAKDRFR